jgi:hypothetical protein
MNKNIVIAVLLIVIAGGAYYWYTQKGGAAMMQANETAGTQTGAETVTPSQDSIGKHAVTWKFEKVSEAKDDGSPQKTKVTVTWDGKSHDAGTYEGSCAEIDGSNGTLQEGEVSGALCWFAGAGDEIGVFAENGGFVLKHGEQQEPSGEGAGFRGNFKALLTL